MWSAAAEFLSRTFAWAAACPGADLPWPAGADLTAEGCAAVTVGAGLSVAPVADGLVPGLDPSSFEGSLAALAVLTIAAIVTILVVRECVTSRTDFLVLGALWGAALTLAVPSVVMAAPVVRTIAIGSFPLSASDAVAAFCTAWCLVRFVWEKLAGP